MNDDDDDGDVIAFGLPAADFHPADIAARLMKTETHRHLLDSDVKLGYLMRMEPKESKGKVELGSVHDAKYMAQGAFKDLFVQLLVGMLGFMPDFVVVLDREFWHAAEPLEREALLFHELCHVQQALDKFGSPRFDMNGNPVYKIKEHDVTAFRAEVAAYGAWTADLREFLTVADRARGFA